MTAAAPLAAAQAALAAENAAVYGYGVVGARVDAAHADQARAGYAAHLAARDAARRAVRALGADPVVADAAYALPFPITGPGPAVRLAAQLEDRVADAYAVLVAASTGTLRTEAASRLRDAAVRAVRWRGTGPAFPGLPDRASAGSPSPTAPVSSPAPR